MPEKNMLGDKLDPVHTETREVAELPVTLTALERLRAVVVSFIEGTHPRKRVERFEVAVIQSTLNVILAEIDKIDDPASDLLAALNRTLCPELTDWYLCPECRADGRGCLRYAAIARAEGRQ